MSGVSLQNFTRRRTAPRAVFSAIAAAVLPGWDISLAFVGAARARALNIQLRGKDYVPNVLSYIVGEKSAEIIICPSEATKQAPDFLLPASSFLLLLFIHGALHIKGWVHGDKMELCERKLLAKFAKSITQPLPNGTTHRNRHRHRHVPDKNGRGGRALR
jgi:rRNA maturation RNase YbeY